MFKFHLEFRTKKVQVVQDHEFNTNAEYDRLNKRFFGLGEKTKKGTQEF